MKLINKIFCIIIFLNLFTLIGCNKKPKLSASNTWFQIESDKITNLKGELVQKFTCGKTATNLNKKFSYRLEKEAGLHYFFYCKPTASGRALNMKIYFNDQLVQDVNALAEKSIRDDVSFIAQSWLVDLDKDGFLDLVQRSYSLNNSEEGLFKVLSWNYGKQNLIEKKLDVEAEKKYKDEFKVD